jgi:hypothetical protein
LAGTRVEFLINVLIQIVFWQPQQEIQPDHKGVLAFYCTFFGEKVHSGDFYR